MQELYFLYPRLIVGSEVGDYKAAALLAKLCYMTTQWQRTLE